MANATQQQKQQTPDPKAKEEDRKPEATEQDQEAAAKPDDRTPETMSEPEFAVLTGLSHGGTHHVAAMERPYVDDLRRKHWVTTMSSGHLQWTITDAGMAAWRAERDRRDGQRLDV